MLKMLVYMGLLNTFVWFNKKGIDHAIITLKQAIIFTVITFKLALEGQFLLKPLTGRISASVGPITLKVCLK
jgi:hypothetical protein